MLLGSVNIEDIHANIFTVRNEQNSIVRLAV